MLAEVDSIAALTQPQRANVRLPNKTHIALGTRATIFAGPTRESSAWHRAMVTKVALERRQAIIGPAVPIQKTDDEATSLVV